MRVRRATFGLILSLLWFGGCAPGATGTDPVFPTAGDRLDEQETGVPPWPFWPRSMRLHPLSQVMTDRKSGELRIEARVEFLDEHGHTTKALGRIRIDLYQAGASGPSSEPIESWFEDLRDLALNWDHYDEVTRTYLLSLEIDAAILPDEPELVARFLSSDGLQFESSLLLRR